MGTRATFSSVECSVHRILKGARMSTSQGDSGSVTTIDALLQETRVFPPAGSFVERAMMHDPDVYARAAADPDSFWAQAAERLDWFRKWDTVLEWKAPWAKWFLGGQLNASYN